MAIITPQTAAINARNSHASRRRNSAPNALKCIGLMQERLQVLTLDGKTVAREAAQCACAWDKLEARKAILQGKPANTSQSIRADTPKKGRRQSQQASAPIESESEQDEPTKEPTKEP